MFGLFCSPLDYLYARFKLYQNDEKFIPHFRRTELFPSGGGKPEGKEGEQYSHVGDVHLIPRLSTPNPPNERCMSARVTPKQTGTDLNPAESIFGGVNLIQMRASVHKCLIRRLRARRNSQEETNTISFIGDLTRSERERKARVFPTGADGKISRREGRIIAGVRVYVEVVLINNLAVDALIVYAVMLARRRKVHKLRFLSAVALGAAVATAYPVLPEWACHTRACGACPRDVRDFRQIRQIFRLHNFSGAVFAR